jgi:DNA repair protein RecN (Recombination protein N)
MLQSLSIRNIALIDALTLDFEAGICILTGETGAGKSILLDALGLALGARTETRLLRQGEQKPQVTATFSLAPTHLLWQELEDHGIPYEDNTIIFRRFFETDGKSKCFLNDQNVTLGLMRRLSAELVEIHGQFDQLLEAKAHLIALDAYGKLDKRGVQETFKLYQEAQKNLKIFQENLAKSFERETFLRFSIEEMERIAPRLGEEEQLESERSLISHRAKIADSLVVVENNISSALSTLSQSHKALIRIQDLLPTKVTPLAAACDRAILEAQEVMEGMKTLAGEVEGTPHSLETLENRLHALRSLSRKYQTHELLSCLEQFKQELIDLGQGEDRLHSLEETVKKARDLYFEKAHLLSEKRHQVARNLEAAIAPELPPLKLEHAQFRVHFEKLPEENWGGSGMDRVEFYIKTNPGSPEGPLSAIASGGERSRLMLALKVLLAQSSAIPTLIFDEIESGTGGAVASAMGERLKALSQTIQVLAITHSPQIASRGSQHLIVFKEIMDGVMITQVKALTPEARHEEIARMLAGEEITEEARAAAKRLIGNGR